MMLALGAHVQVSFQFRLPNGLAAAQALGPQTFGANVSFARVRAPIAAGAGFVLAVITLEPGHAHSLKLKEK
jgi:hypothetical protein